ncbi:MAG TPA: membrane dipeptidase [Tahibacter sp.]|uniref:dipeptidase n=1 Tax=Tahibacter sp. TaxID=2056211 RepID=UPI002B796C9A|nr:membrane dipeptidase [Tahibacter sp.]HSX62578.1 membrane dipeptidase [Tahibacter sp.]
MKKPSIVLCCCLALAACATSSPRRESLHGRLLTLDTHLDTPMHFGRAGWSFADRHDYATDLVQVDLARMDAGALDGGFFVIYTAQGELTPEGYASALAFARTRADRIAETVAALPARIAPAARADDAARLTAAGMRFAYMSMENSYPLGENLELLAEFRERGVRMAGPVHTKNNQFADSATDEPRWNGLSPLGRDWVREMNRLGLIIDASHASDAAFDQMLELSRTPLLLSHSGSRTVWNHPRNLDDARIRKLAAQGGVICATTVYLSAMNIGREREALFGRLERIAELSPPEQAALTAQTRALDMKEPLWNVDVDAFMKSLRHLIDVAGIDHVCMGGDWDGGGGVRGLDDISALPEITSRLRRAGFSEADLQKLWSGNVLRVLREAETRRAQ